jgi:hypothetical protein
MTLSIHRASSLASHGPVATPIVVCFSSASHVFPEIPLCPTPHLPSCVNFHATQSSSARLYLAIDPPAELACWRPSSLWENIRMAPSVVGCPPLRRPCPHAYVRTGAHRRPMPPPKANVDASSDTTTSSRVITQPTSTCLRDHLSPLPHTPCPPSHPPAADQYNCFHVLEPLG